MPDITGLEIARRLAPRQKRPLLLFVTNHDELVYDSFQYHKIGKSVLKENPELHSTKEEKELHGIGISQIKEIVAAYDGLYDFYEEEGYFCSRVFIPQ